MFFLPLFQVLGIGADMPAMAFDDGARNGEAQARSLAGAAAFGGVEGREQLLVLLFIATDAVILNAEHHHMIVNDR